jgi:hypothetical protein
MLILAFDLILTEASFDGFDEKNSLAAKSPLTLAIGSDSKRIEDRMDEALSGLNSWNAARLNKNSTKSSIMPQNSSAQNLSNTNSSAINSSALNTSEVLPAISEENKLKSNEAQAASLTTLEGNSSVGLDGVSTSSKANFNGYYGMTASRHEIGKSKIESKMALNGAFEVDKTVKFQDLGF